MSHSFMFTSQGAKRHKAPPPNHVFDRCKIMLLLLGDYSIYIYYLFIILFLENIIMWKTCKFCWPPHIHMDTWPHLIYSCQHLVLHNFIHKLILKISMAHSKVLSCPFTRWRCFCYWLFFSSFFSLTQYAAPPVPPHPPSLPTFMLLFSLKMFLPC